MEKKVATLIRILGIGIMELIIEIDLEVGLFNSIECDKDNKVYLHIFEEDDLDISVDFTNLSDDDQMRVLVLLSSIVYN